MQPMNPVLLGLITWFTLASLVVFAAPRDNLTFVERRTPQERLPIVIRSLAHSMRGEVSHAKLEIRPELNLLLPVYRPANAPEFA